MLGREDGENVEMEVKCKERKEIWPGAAEVPLAQISTQEQRHYVSRHGERDLRHPTNYPVSRHPTIIGVVPLTSDPEVLG